MPITSARMIVVAALVAWLAGCARYQSKPLTMEAVNAQLSVPDDAALQLSARELHHPILKPLPVDLTDGMTPDEAAVIAVVVNPELRAERNQRSLAAAQLLQAGLLPNPQLVGGIDFPTGSKAPDNHTAYNVGVDWEVSSLMTRDAKVRAATAEAASVDLDVAWKEWQVAQEARLAAFGVMALEEQLKTASQADQQLTDNLDVVKRAVDHHQKTLLDLAAAESSAQDAHAAVIAQEKELAHQRLALNRALGFPSDRAIDVKSAADLPSHLDPPASSGLSEGVEERRLDLLALKRGYESQDATLRAAILAQFPKLNLGVNTARDTSDVRTIGLGVSIDLPIFDRNQAVIATETATRQKLFDEYTSRIFAARSEIAMAIADIHSTNSLIDAAKSAVPALERLVQTYASAMQQGNLDILSFYTAQAGLFQKRSELLKLKQQLVANWVALEIASGQYLPMAESSAGRVATSRATGPTSAPTSDPTTQESTR